MSARQQPQPHDTNGIGVQNIAIIGAGPTGIAAAKYLLAEQSFTRITIYESRARAGGLWDYDQRTATKSRYAVPLPQTDPYYEILQGADQDPDDALTPLYDDLETNIPRGLMGFSDLLWPDDVNLFPRHEAVRRYILQYAEEVAHLIRFRTRVEDVQRNVSESGKTAWRVCSRAEGQSEVVREEYDAVVVAVGHYAVPSVPDVPGLREWDRTYPGSVTHSMLFKNAEPYRGKKTLLIGGGASGVDIAAHLTTTCALPLLHSQRSASFLPTDPHASRLSLPDITLLDPMTRAVHFADGRIEHDVDAILFCTGYLYSFPFLRSLTSSPQLVTDGARVRRLYRHLFWQRDATLVFPCLQVRIIPFPMAEVQAAVVARVWSGRLDLPAQEEMAAWEQRRLEEVDGVEGKFHLLAFPEDAHYITHMHDWAVSAAGEEGVGKTPPRWGGREYWLRERFGLIRKAYRALGEERLQVRSVEELGFSYDEWRREQEEEVKE